MARIFVPASSPSDWQRLLAEPAKHWRTGYSARTLAHCWHAADGFPPEIQSLFETSELHRLDLVMAIPEHKVLLPPRRGHPSQNDLFALGRTKSGELVSIAVEAKVSEPFDKTVAEWQLPPSPGKSIRIGAIAELLGLPEAFDRSVRYQLLHRLASAIIEARTFNAKCAAIVVHSFSQTDEWFSDYEAFLRLFGATARVGELVRLKGVPTFKAYAGWARGEPRFLAA